MLCDCCAHYADGTSQDEALVVAGWGSLAQGGPNSNNLMVGQ
jgi:hypothetical protein